MELIWSRYAHFVKVDNTNCLFHSLNFCLVCTDFTLKPKPHMVLSNDEKLLMSPALQEKLMIHGLLITGPEVDRKLINNVISASNKLEICNLILLISNKCNMDCSYCQIEKNIPGAKHNMTIDIALEALCLFENICFKESKLTINFTGGEPLLNFDVMCSAVKYIKNSNVLSKARLVVFTNGTLLDQEIAEFFKANDFLVIVSLDGAAEKHDTNRKFSDGTSTYQQALLGYLLVRDYGCNCAISSVANLSCDDFDNWLKWLIELKPMSVGLNYPHLLLSGGVNDINFYTYTSQILRANKVLGENGISLENYERFSRVYDYNKIRRRECQACGRGLTINANGNVGPCKSLLVSERIFTSLTDCAPLNDSKFIDWAERTPLNSELCLNCPAVSICGGGCAYDTYCLFDGNFSEMDRRMCSHIRSIFFDLLFQRVRNLKKDFDDFFIIMEPRYQEIEGKIFESVGH